MGGEKGYRWEWRRGVVGGEKGCRWEWRRGVGGRGVIQRKQLLTMLEWFGGMIGLTCAELNKVFTNL